MMSKNQLVVALCLLFPMAPQNLHFFTNFGHLIFAILSYFYIRTCYPFVEKDAHKAKKTSSKALVMAHAYSNVIMDKIEEAVKNGLVGNESDNW